MKLFIFLKHKYHINYEMKLESLLLSNPIFDKIGDMVRESYSDSCICFIDEVINDDLEKLFLKRKESIKKRNKKVEVRQLFHGTSEGAVNSIARDGFCTNYNKVSAFGIGSYFAKDAMYSFNYMHPGRKELSYMFLADVLIGKMEKGSATQRAHPDVDTLVNTIVNPSIFVTPYDDGAFPRYIIAFHKNAVV